MVIELEDGFQKYYSKEGEYKFSKYEHHSQLQHNNGEFWYNK